MARNTSEMIRDILTDVLASHASPYIEKEQKRTHELLTTIRKLLREHSIDATVMLGGSAAKGTALGDDFDVDIFVQFNLTKYKDVDISALLKKALASLKPVVVHGSRDYLKIADRYEIIPVLKVKHASDAINITDASPFHAAWVQKKIKEHDVRDDIRLFKLFLKAAGVYGAESYIKGISGHVTDIIIIYYGSFLKAIRAISRWKEEMVIDVEKHKSLRIIDKAKRTGPLVVIDPIVPNRNAAAAVGKDAYDILRTYATDFLKQPSRAFFEPELLTPEKITQLHSQYAFVLSVGVPEGKVDIVGARLLKGFEYVCNELREFGIQKADWFWDKKQLCVYCITPEKKQLPATFEHTGPLATQDVHAKAFKKKYPNARIKDGRYVATVRRTYTSVIDKLAAIQTSSYLAERGLVVQ